MINISLLQQFVDEDPKKVLIVNKKPKSYRHSFNSHKIEELIAVEGDDIYCQVLSTDGITDYERMGLISKSEFFSWIRDNKINKLLDENLG